MNPESESFKSASQKSESPKQRPESSSRHGVLDALKARASWRGIPVAELAGLAGVPERKDSMLELKDSSSWVSKQRGNEVSQWTGQVFPKLRQRSQRIALQACNYCVLEWG